MLEIVRFKQQGLKTNLSQKLINNITVFDSIACSQFISTNNKPIDLFIQIAVYCYNHVIQPACFVNLHINSRLCGSVTRFKQIPPLSSC